MHLALMENTQGVKSPSWDNPERNTGQSFRLLRTAESVFELHGEASYAKDTKQEKGAPRAFRVCLGKTKETQNACGHSDAIWRPRNSSG